MNKEELERRTLEFSIRLVRLLKKLPKNQINYNISGQLFNSGTSIGANYREANGSESPKDFLHKIGISFEESRETHYWLSLLIANNLDFEIDINPLLSEADEFRRIFGKAVTTCKKNQNSKIKNQK